MARPLVEETPQTGFNVTPIGSSQRDVEAYLRMNAEQFRLLYPRINFRQLDRQETLKDELYHEWVKEPYFKDPILIPVLVVPEPPKKLLKQYGLEEEQEAIAIFNCRLNEKAEVFPRTGDQVQYLNIWWEILTAKMEYYFNNTQVPLNIVCTLKNANVR